MGVGALAGIAGGALAAGGSIGGAALSKPKTPTVSAGFNPIQGVLSNLFGVPLIPGKHGLIAPRSKKTGNAISEGISRIYAQGGSVDDVIAAIRSGSFGSADNLDISPGFGFQFANPIFSPNDFDILGELKNALPLNDPQRAARDLAETGRLGVGSVARANDINSTLDFFRGPLTGYANELARTGFRTSAEPVAAQARNNFRNQILPDIASRYGGYTNALSSDFAGDAQRIGSDLEFDIRALQTQLDEAANARRVGGIPLAQNLGVTTAGLPFALAQTLQSLGSSFYQEDSARRPGQQMLSLLQALGGLASGQPFNGPVTPTNQGTQVGLDAISNLINPIASGLGESFADSFRTPGSRQPDLDEVISSFRNAERSGLS